MYNMLQAVLFPRGVWTSVAAADWIRVHGLRVRRYALTDTYFCYTIRRAKAKYRYVVRTTRGGISLVLEYPR